MQITVYSYAGKNKQYSDDTVVVNDRYINNAELSADADAIQIIGVADGVGGNAGGQKASMFVAKTLCTVQQELTNYEAVYDLFSNTNSNLIRFAGKNPGEEMMATTFSGLVAGGDGIYLAHIGNTRIYRLQGMYLRQLTTDQTTRQLLMSRYGFEAAETANRNEIYACMGGGSGDLFVPFVVEKIQPFPESGLFVITSDGIHDYVSIEAMETILKSFETDRERAEAMAQEALQSGSEDDRSVVLIRY